MLERARQLSERLRFDPAKAGLGWWLAAINVSIVLVVVGWHLLLRHRHAARFGRRTGQGARAARRRHGARGPEQGRRRCGNRGARARRPPDAAAPGHGRQPDTLELFLRRFCQTEAINACAVFQGSELLAQAGETLPWNEIVTASAEQGESFLAAPTAPHPRSSAPRQASAKARRRASTSCATSMCSWRARSASTWACRYA
jgi:hypothetical protein